jgi:hypothetical protein
MNPLSHITKWFELLAGNHEVNYYKQRGMNQQEAERMVETHQLPNEKDAFDNDYDKQADEL